MTQYIYQNHETSELYATNIKLSYTDRLCPKCNDVDWFLGEANSKAEAKKLIKGLDLELKSEYINSFVNTVFVR